jgi:xanthine permease
MTDAVIMAEAIDLGMAPAALRPADEMPPLPQLAVFGLQHVLVMYAGAVAVPLIVGQALGLGLAQVAFLISADLFACGLATLVQTIGFPGVGIRLPVMMGVTFASVSPMMATIAAGKALGRPADETLSTIYGAVIVAGVVGFLAAPLIGRLARLFPPVVTGTVILTIGLTLLQVGINWVGGGQPGDPAYGAPVHLGIAAFVLAVILLIVRFSQGFFKHVAVLAGVLAGVALCVALGRMDFAGVAAAPWFGLILPFHFGLPRVEPVSTATMCLVMLVTMVESLGMFLAVGWMVGSPPTPRDIVRGFRGDALGGIIGGLFNTFPYTTFSQNVGLVGVTNVRSRFVCVAAAVIMLALALCPKLAAGVASVPSYVLGGAGLVMFGMVAAAGIRILLESDLIGRPNTLLIIAVSLSVGMAPVLAPTLLAGLPSALKPLTGSGIVLGAICAVSLNLLFGGAPQGAQLATPTTKNDEPGATG